MLYFIRHGQTPWNVQQKIQGWTDIELDDVGLKQSIAACDFLQDHNIHAIYSSPLLRTKYLAVLLGESHGLPVIYDWRLLELKAGDFEGKSWREVEATHGAVLQEILKSQYQIPLPNGESLEMLRARAMAVVQEAIQIDPDQNIIFVTHGGTIRTILCTLLDVNLTDREQFAVENGSITILENNNHQWTIKAVLEPFQGGESNG